MLNASAQNAAIQVEPTHLLEVLVLVPVVVIGRGVGAA